MFAPEALTAFEVAAADLHTADIHDGVVRVELAVAALEWLGHALDTVNDAEAADQIHIHAGRVADEAEHGLIFALGNVDGQALTLEPVDELLALCGFHAMFEYDDHDVYLRCIYLNFCFCFSKEKCGTGSTCAA